MGRLPDIIVDLEELTDYMSLFNEEPHKELNAGNLRALKETGLPLTGQHCYAIERDLFAGEEYARKRILIHMPDGWDSDVELIRSIHQEVKSRFNQIRKSREAYFSMQIVLGKLLAIADLEKIHVPSNLRNAPSFGSSVNTLLTWALENNDLIMELSLKVEELIASREEV